MARNSFRITNLNPEGPVNNRNKKLNRNNLLKKNVEIKAK